MNFGFTEEQNLLREQVSRFMAEACSMAKVRELMATEDGFDDTLWRQVSELGWLGLTIPEKFGGLGLKWIDLAVVLEECGRGLCPLPVASQALTTAAVARCGSDDHKANWLPSMADGSAVCTLALYDEPNWIDPAAITLTGARVPGAVRISGVKPFVSDAMAAQYFLLGVRVDDSLALAALSKDQVEVTAEPVMDRTKGHRAVSFSQDRASTIKYILKNVCCFSLLHTRICDF